MSDEKKVTHPGPDDPEAIHWTAGDARRTFHEKGEERPDPRQESDRKRTTASTPLRRTDSRGAQGRKPRTSRSRIVRLRRISRHALRGAHVRLGCA